MTLAPRTKLALLVTVALALAGALLAAAGPATTSATARGGCANANALPNEASIREFRRAMTCLVNRKRARRGLPAVHSVGKLRRVEQRHVKVMLRRDCFKHRCRGERSLKRRLRSAGYLRGSTWAYGEVLGYDTTPRKLLRAWMNHSYHRKHILGPVYEDLGVGVGKGTPNPRKPDAAFITYSIVLGVVA